MSEAIENKSEPLLNCLSNPSNPLPQKIESSGEITPYTRDAHFIYTDARKQNLAKANQARKEQSELRKILKNKYEEAAAELQKSYKLQLFTLRQSIIDAGKNSGPKAPISTPTPSSPVLPEPEMSASSSSTPAVVSSASAPPPSKRKSKVKREESSDEEEKELVVESRKKSKKAPPPPSSDESSSSEEEVRKKKSRKTTRKNPKYISSSDESSVEDPPFRKPTKRRTRKPVQEILSEESDFDEDVRPVLKDREKRRGVEYYHGGRGIPPPQAMPYYTQNSQVGVHSGCRF